MTGNGETLPAEMSAPSLQTSPRCVDDQTASSCTGVAQLRPSLSSTGLQFARCGGHWAARLRLQDEIRARYPDRPPANFDPGYAGECWDEDE